MAWQSREFPCWNMCDVAAGSEEMRQGVFRCHPASYDVPWKPTDVYDPVNSFYSRLNQREMKGVEKHLVTCIYNIRTSNGARVAERKWNTTKKSVVLSIEKEIVKENSFVKRALLFVPLKWSFWLIFPFRPLSRSFSKRPFCPPCSILPRIFRYIYIYTWC